MENVQKNMLAIAMRMEQIWEVLVGGEISSETDMVKAIDRIGET